MNHKKINSELLEQKKKDSVCRNDFQRAIWDLAKKNNQNLSNSEFWSFFNAVDFCLTLKDSELDVLRKLR